MCAVSWDPVAAGGVSPHLQAAAAAGAAAAREAFGRPVALFAAAEAEAVAAAAAAAAAAARGPSRSGSPPPRHQASAAAKYRYLDRRAALAERDRLRAHQPSVTPPLPPRCDGALSPARRPAAPNLAGAQPATSVERSASRSPRCPPGNRQVSPARRPPAGLPRGDSVPQPPHGCAAAPPGRLVYGAPLPCAVFSPADPELDDGLPPCSAADGAPEQLSLVYSPSPARQQRPPPQSAPLQPAPLPGFLRALEVDFSRGSAGAAPRRTPALAIV
eukprot:TRINITY_DN22666_c0_g1_i1.p1 TRINITY_DN22666_c0_g1~~TRINITY_DN22666_c0_g1_i1.p1  ORF type:complete len:297 (+),score=63.11 TRINITY_DN22666_c0_g1_i1:73-891(+)